MYIYVYIHLCTYMVKYIHICIMNLVHDNMVTNEEQNLKTTPAFVVSF